MMAGLPVICSPLPELTGIVRAHASGILVEPDNPQKVAAAIEALFDDSDRYGKCVQNAKKAATVLNWDREKEKLKALYQRFI